MCISPPQPSSGLLGQNRQLGSLKQKCKWLEYELQTQQMGQKLISDLYPSLLFSLALKHPRVFNQLCNASDGRKCPT